MCYYNSHNLMEKLHKLHSKATSFDSKDREVAPLISDSLLEGATCFNCSGELSTDESNLIMFFCGHMYHQSCVSHKNDVS